MATTQTRPQTQTIWTFDSTHSRIAFEVEHLTVTTVTGSFTDFEGTIDGDPDDPAHAHAEVTIQAASIGTGNMLRDATLRRADFMDVKHYPTITFRSTRIEPVRKNHFHIYGDLTIHGVTKEIELDIVLNRVGKNPDGMRVAGISAETILTRQDFDLTWNAAVEMLVGGVVVGDTATITVEIKAIEQAPTRPERRRHEIGSLNEGHQCVNRRSVPTAKRR